MAALLQNSNDVSKIQVEKLNAPLGAKITGVDFSQPIIHEGLLRRINTENFKLKRSLSKLKPYDIEFFKSLI